jgi:V8-like Glu-specific endopeptidase
LALILTGVAATLLSVGSSTSASETTDAGDAGNVTFGDLDYEVVSVFELVDHSRATDMEVLVSTDEDAVRTTLGQMATESRVALAGDEVAVYGNGSIASAVPNREPLQVPEEELPTTPEQDFAQMEKMTSSGNPTFEPERSGPAPRAIFGSDGRSRRTPTTTIPSWSEVELFNPFAGHCTGTLYRSNKIVTSAHCLYNAAAGSFYPVGSWSVELARDGNTHHYPACQGVKAFVLGSYPSDPNDPKDDFGGLKINCNYPGNIGNTQAPIVNISANPQTYKDGLRIYGYPVNAGGSNVVDQQWGMTGRLIYDTSFLKTLNLDTSPGQSGAGWYIPCSSFGWTYCSVGQHYGSAAFFYGGMNVAHQTTGPDITLLVNFN